MLRAGSQSGRRVLGGSQTRVSGTPEVLSSHNPGLALSLGDRPVFPRWCFPARLGAEGEAAVRGDFWIELLPAWKGSWIPPQTTI